MRELKANKNRSLCMPIYLDTFLQFEINNRLTIHHEIMLNIFVPFVTNKPEDSGIGLAVT